MKHIYMRWLLSAIVSAFGTGQASAQITLHEATNVTQTKATLSADFPDLSVEHGFQYKYGTLPEIDDFSRTALSPSSEPVNITTTGTYAWSARTAKGWVESNMQVPVGQASSMSAEITLTEATPISFEWSVDSEDNIGLLSFIVDGETVGSITGLVDFEKFTYTLPEGTHKVEWQYKKSASTSIGLDLAKVKNITFANTTPGEWIEIKATADNVAVENLYPDNSYVYRAFSKEAEELSYSQIYAFCTETVNIGSVGLQHVSQTSATLEFYPQPGDADIKFGYELFDNAGYDYPEFYKCLFAPDTYGGEVVTDSNLKDWNVYDDEEWNCVSSIYTLSLTFTLEKPTKISFEWANRSYNGKCTPYLIVDGINKDYYISVSNIKPSDFKKFDLDLSEGTHTIEWHGGSYRQSLNNNYYGTNYLRNLSIPGLKKHLVDTVELSCEGIPVVNKKTGLLPNTEYRVIPYMISDIKSPLSDGWKECISEGLSFTTLPVEAKITGVIDITQSSAKLVGEVIAGDATITVAGLQYKDNTSNRWIDLPKDVTSTEISHKITRLKPNTKYDYRSYLQAQDCDTVFSEIGVFTTLAVEAYKPELKKVTQHEATLQGKVIFGDANIYQRGMQFRKKGVTEWEEVEDAGNDSIYTLVRKDLEMATSYEARTYVQPAGCDLIYSDILELKTLDTYFTGCNSNERTQATVTLVANLSDIDEGMTVDEYGFEYFINSDGFFESADTFEKSDIFTIPVSPDGKEIKAAITGLAPQLGIKWRAYASIGGQKYYFAGLYSSEWAYARTDRATIKATVQKITATSISLELDATQEGDAEVSQIEYALVDSFQDTPQYSVCGNVLTIDKLTPDTKYNFRFRGLVNDRYCPLLMTEHEDYSWFEFATLPVSVGVKFSDITQTKAKMKISVDAGDAEVTDLRYRLNSGEYIACSDEVMLTGLKPGTKYSVVIYGKVNGKDYVWAESSGAQASSFSFTTKPIKAYITVSDVQQTSAKFISSFQYGDATLVSSGVIIGGVKYENINEGVATELLPETNYNCQTYVETKEGGMTYSNIVKITTRSISCESQPVSNISNRSATMNGVIDCDANSSAEFGFQWKKMTGWNSDPAFTKGHKLDDGSISVALVNGMLDPDTDYQYRPAVRYQDKIYYAPTWTTFRTEQEFVYYPASVYTLFRTDRENNALVLCGYYVAGSETVVSQGYEYWRSDRHSSRAEAPVSPSVVTTDESMQYVFNPGDLPNGDYKVRAFVKTESGNTIYGSTVGFTASNSGYSGIEDIAYDEPEIKVENAMVKIYNADGLECNIYALTGVMVASHRISGDCYEIALTPNSFYIVHLSNGLVRKIRL